MNTKPKNLKFNRKPVGEVTRGGGFSSLVKEAEAGTITVLYKFNEPVAILLPCDRTMEMAYEISAGAGVFVANAEQNNTPRGLMERFFRSLIEVAGVAKMIMGLDSFNADVQLVEKQVLDNVRAFVSSQKNSSEESGSVPPMTTARADVSEVKHGEVVSTSPLPRKRGRPRKN